MSTKKYRETHKEKIKAYSKAYYQTHKGRILARQKVYYQTHKEKKEAYNKAYRQAHREEKNAYQRAWYQLHKEEKSAQPSFRFGKKLGQLKIEYGTGAVRYYLAHPACEDCGESRPGVINIHHINGRGKEDFRTLCFNCHRLEHHKDYSLPEDYLERGKRFLAKVKED